WVTLIRKVRKGQPPTGRPARVRDTAERIFEACKVQFGALQRLAAFLSRGVTSAAAADPGFKKMLAQKLGFPPRPSVQKYSGYPRLRQPNPCLGGQDGASAGRLNDHGNVADVELGVTTVHQGKENRGSARDESAQ